LRNLLVPSLLVASLATPCLAQQRQLVFGEAATPETVRIEGTVPVSTGSVANPMNAPVILPQANATTFGNTNNSIPFAYYPNRYQQVFLGSEMPASHRVIGLGLRQDQALSGPTYRGATIEVEIRIGYTTLDHTTLTTTFDSNWNAGTPLQVLPRTSFKLPDFRTPAPTDPSVFLIQIPFKLPFTWVQTAGRNLLIEIVVWGNDRYATFAYYPDAASGTTVTTTRLYSAGFPTAPVGTIGRNYGLVMAMLDALKTAADYSYYGTGCKGTGGFAGDVLPSYYATSMGGSTNTIPFSQINYRYQQVLLGSELPAPAVYNALHFRQGGSAITGGNVNLKLDIGYTTYDPATLTTTFASNYTSGPLTTVYDGTFSFPALPTPNTNPAAFDKIGVPFNAPWIYTPAAGKNILFEVLNRNTTSISAALDNCSGAPNATTTRLYASGTAAVTGSATRNYGIVVGFGKAGNGSAVPLLTNTGYPLIGTPIEIVLSAARKSSVAICPIGSSNTMWGALPLPFDMTVLNAPGCFLRAALDGVLLGVATDASGNGKFTLPIPNAVGLVGVKFYNQFLVFDAPANTLGIVVTNGGVATIGEM
jgi:hypothetical protein